MPGSRNSVDVGFALLLAKEASQAALETLESLVRALRGLPGLLKGTDILSAGALAIGMQRLGERVLKTGQPMPVEGGSLLPAPLPDELCRRNLGFYGKTPDLHSTSGCTLVSLWVSVRLSTFKPM